MKILPLLVGLGSAALLPSAAPCAEARCRCREVPAVAEAADRAAAVFSGRALSVTQVRDPSGYVELRVVFRVGAAWKGLAADTVAVFTGLGGGDCGYPFLAGREYLVFAGGDAGDLFTGTCSRTRPLEEAAADLADLGVPRRPR